MFAVKLDRIDLKLIEALQRNARVSNQDLAEYIGLSPSACLGRVRRLEAEGLFQRFAAQLNLSRLAAHLELFVEITLKNHAPIDFKRFEQAIGAVAEVLQAFQLSGDHDYLLHVLCRDIAHYRSIIDPLIEADSNIAKVISHVVITHAKPPSLLPQSVLESSNTTA
jgi:DNA-binding Lrp family transcriptional regulator